MAKSPSLRNDTVTRDTIAQMFDEPDVTMVRLAREDRDFAQNVQFLVSARLEGTGLFNIRESRKVTERDLEKNDAVDQLWSFAQKLSGQNKLVLVGVQRKVLTKRRMAVGDLLAKVAQVDTSDDAEEPIDISAQG